MITHTVLQQAKEMKLTFAHNVFQQGQTGFPWIDAIMVQLKKDGWIHHLARHAVACFLTRGDLWISWEEGMKVRKIQSYSPVVECLCYILEAKVTSQKTKLIFVFTIRQ